MDDGISVPKRAKKDFFHSISSSNRNLPVDLEVDNFLNDPLKTKESILKFPKLKKHVYPLQYGFAVISLGRKTFQPRGRNI